MCHPEFHLISHGDSRKEARRFMWLQMVGLSINPPSPATPTVVGAGAAAMLGGSRKMKQYCLCSPTQHPGSFRCKYHQAEYEWGGGKRLPKFITTNATIANTTTTAS